MAVQRGKDLLVKVDVDGTGRFVTMAGLRASRVTFNAGAVDVTSVDSAEGWRELLGGASAKQANIAGSGVFRDEATDARARQLFWDGQVVDYQVILPDFGTVQGPFQITSLELAGSHDGEATYELSLASAGALTFVAA